MYLLDTNKQELHQFQDASKVEGYAILSHTWHPLGEEILFKHVESRSFPDKCLKGIDKVVGCCWQAKQDGLNWVWIDTCCIDQSSSAELSEAINSMFQIYMKCTRCYVYLSDVHTDQGADAPNSSFRSSKWFTRGWTLQELIAPSSVEFFTSDWRRIGDRHSMAKIIEEITGIESDILCGVRPVSDLPIAKAMSYTASRRTTRTEDNAYSLLGLFSVNMPTIYGEGDHAFSRLQYEIMARSPAHSLLAWKDTRLDEPSSVLASRPSYFAKSRNVVDIPYGIFARAWNLQGQPVGFQKGPLGLQAILPIFDVVGGHGIDAIMVIACKVVDPVHQRQHTVGLALARRGDHFFRPYQDVLINVDCLAYLNVPWSCKSITLADRDGGSLPYLVSQKHDTTMPTGIVVNHKSANFAFVRTSSDHTMLLNNSYDVTLDGRQGQVCPYYHFG